jgi:osmoprotectant transport system ATP-binding protein
VTAIPAADGLAVELRNVGYSLDRRQIVSGISFKVAPGETLILLGRSGTGKTTTLKLINRLLEPSSGEILIEGRLQLEWDPIRLRRRIGYVIQDVGLFPHWTVEENVAMVPRLESWPESRVRQRVREMLELVGLEVMKFGARKPSELSGGQRQRVGVARALAADPPILLMDEPFGALDPVTRAELQREFHELATRLGKAIIFVTHDVREALLIGTHIGLFTEGRLNGIYEPDQFLHSTDPEARAFVDSLGNDDGRNASLPQSSGRGRKA